MYWDMHLTPENQHGTLKNVGLEENMFLSTMGMVGVDVSFLGV